MTDNNNDESSHRHLQRSSNNFSRKNSLQQYGQSVIGSKTNEDPPLGIIPSSRKKKRKKPKEIQGLPLNDQINTVNNNNNNSSGNENDDQPSFVKKTKSKRTSRVTSFANDNNNNNNPTRRSIDDDINTETFTKENELYQLDILTKQAIQKVKDNIENFKTDINTFIHELRKEQEKVELDEIEKEIQNIQSQISDDLKSTRNHSDMDLDIIRNNFTQFKEDVNSMINDVHEESNRKLDELETAVKNYKDIINSKFDDIENKQTHYIKLLKQILQKSKDETTVDLVQKYLIDDKHIYEKNKREWERQFEEEKKQKENEIREQYENEIQLQREQYEKELEDETKDELEYERMKMMVNEKENELLNKKKEVFMKEAEERVNNENDNILFGYKYKDDTNTKDNEINALERDLHNQINEYYKKSQIMQLAAELPDYYPPIPQFNFPTFQNVPIYNNNNNAIPNTTTTNNVKQPTPVRKEFSVIKERKPSSTNSKMRRPFTNEYAPNVNNDYRIKSEQNVQELDSVVSERYQPQQQQQQYVPSERTFPGEQEIIIIHDNNNPNNPIRTPTYSVKSISDKATVTLPPNQPTPPQQQEQIIKQITPPKPLSVQSQPEQINPTSPLPFHALYKRGKPATTQLFKQTISENFERIIKLDQPLNITKIKNLNGANWEKAKAMSCSLHDKVSFILSHVDKMIDKIDDNTLNLLRYILKTNKPLIPYRFFTEYEYKRLKFDNEGKLLSCNVEQRRMIIAFYIFIKQLVYTFFYKQKIFSQNSLDMLDELSKDNIKIIGSMIFHKTLDVFGSNAVVPVLGGYYPGRDGLEDEQARNNEVVKRKLDKVKKILPEQDEVKCLERDLFSKEEMETYDRVQTPSFRNVITKQMQDIVKKIEVKI